MYEFCVVINFHSFRGSGQNDHAISRSSDNRAKAHRTWQLEGEVAVAP